jgi:hypothetical protein
MNRINKHHLKTAAYAGWIGLGFYRGIKAYDYSYNKYDKDESYMYIYSMGHGCRGSFYYLLFFPIMIHKEIYRLEVNMRNIEKEKESSKKIKRDSWKYGKKTLAFCNKTSS